MSDETKAFETIESPAKKKRSGKAGKTVPAAKARIGHETAENEEQVAFTPWVPEADENQGSDGSSPRTETETEDASALSGVAEVPGIADTQAIPEVEGPGGHTGANGTNGTNGAGRKARVPGVRPVKARIAGTLLTAPDESLNGNGNGNGNGHAMPPNDGLSTNGKALVRSNGHTNGDGVGVKARLAPAGVIPARHNTTSRLRDTDLTGLRLKLKREEWEYKKATDRRQLHSRPLPYFLMRHRATRARTGVGHTRVESARKRFGSNGPASLIIKIFAVLMVLGVFAGIAGIGGVAAAGAYYVGSLPPVTELHGLQVQTTKIYDRNGIPLYDIVDEETGRRHYVSLSDISPLVISATIATEDANFYTNSGVDPVGIVRALYINSSGSGSSGASTITQQVVRQVNLPPEEKNQRTLKRKLREAIQAIRFTQAYSKNDIMEMYLNENYYGHRAYGIDAAALTYFGKPAKELTLPEAALLAGMPQAPTEYDPFVNPDQAKKRQAIVLDLMAKQGYITHAQAEAAKADTLVLRPYQPVLKAPHFVYYVKQYLENMYGPDVDKAGLIVTTTLDLRVQQAAEQVAKDRIAELQKQKATNAAIVIMKPGTGEILGMVGSVDYYNTAIDGQVNVATRERQPGSSFKPITYVTAFEKGWTPGTVLLDTLTSFPNPGQAPYVPKNYDGKDHGWVSVRQALANSLNIPAVKTLQFAGVQDVIDTAHKMGITGLNRGTGWYGLSLTLGGGEVTLLDMTNAYSTFANAGTEVNADPILKIEDPQGRIINCNGAYRAADGSCASTQQKQFADGNGQVFDPRLSYMITSILSDNNARAMEFGLNSPLKTSFPSAAKTGTTNDNRDSWTMGYTPNLTIGVWVGNSNNAEMLAVTGAIGAAVIWHNMMETFYAHPEFVDLVRAPDGSLPRDFVQPPGLIKASACSAKGEIYDLFLKEAPPNGCTTYKDKNKQLHGAPSDTTNRKPTPKPTPMPGIWPPINLPNNNNP